MDREENFLEQVSVPLQPQTIGKEIKNDKTKRVKHGRSKQLTIQNVQQISYEQQYEPPVMELLSDQDNDEGSQKSKEEDEVSEKSVNVSEGFHSARVSENNSDNENEPIEKSENMQILLQNSDRVLRTLEYMAKSSPSRSIKQQTREKNVNQQDEDFASSKQSYEESYRAKTEERCDTTVQDQKEQALFDLSRPDIKLSDRSSQKSERVNPTALPPPQHINTDHRRHSEFIQAKGGSAITNFEAIQAYNASASSHNQNNSNSASKYVGPDNDLDTYKRGLLPTQDLQQQLYYQQLNRQSKQQDNQHKKFYKALNDSSTERNSTFSPSDSNPATENAHAQRLQEMQRQHMHQEYAKRPARDKRCVEAILYSILGFVLFVIVFRVIHLNI